MNLVYCVTLKQKLIITEYALKKMKAFAQRYPWNSEAGGVLLGRHLLDSHDVVVDEVSTPQKTDRRSRFSFFRSYKHEEVAHERWQQELNTSAYLGLWHTHPERDPLPSSVDHLDWQKAVSSDTYEGDRLFFPIIGTHCIRIWTLSRKGTFRELNLKEKNAQRKSTNETETQNCSND